MCIFVFVVRSFAFTCVGLSLALDFHLRWTFPCVGLSLALDFHLRWTFTCVGLSLALNFSSSEVQFGDPFLGICPLDTGRIPISPDEKLRPSTAYMALKQRVRFPYTPVASVEERKAFYKTYRSAFLHDRWHDLAIGLLRPV
eukprot:scaffold8348_cov258-Pinguiococcus_pyrenoidosus.AAC.2